MAREKKPIPIPGRSPEWFETILCSLNEGVFFIDNEWKITCFNKAASVIIGVSREDAPGAPCSEVLRSIICEGACALRYTRETGKPLANLAITITNSEGEVIPISISTSVL